MMPKPSEPCLAVDHDDAQIPGRAKELARSTFTGDAENKGNSFREVPAWPPNRSKLDVALVQNLFGLHPTKSP